VLPLPALVHEGPQRNGSIRDKKRRLCEYITAPDKHQRYLRPAKHQKWVEGEAMKGSQEEGINKGTRGSESKGQEKELNEDELERAQEMKKMNDIAATGCLNATYFEVF